MKFNPFDRPVLTATVAMVANVVLAAMCMLGKSEMLKVAGLLFAVGAAMMLFAILVMVTISRGDPAPAFLQYMFFAILNVLAIVILFFANFAGMLAVVGVGLGIFLIVASRDWKISHPTWLSDKNTLPIIGWVITFISIWVGTYFWF